VRDKDWPSDFKNFILVAFNVLFFVFSCPRPYVKKTTVMLFVFDTRPLKFK
jgi:hypothetical protein